VSYIAVILDNTYRDKIPGFFISTPICAGPVEYVTNRRFLLVDSQRSDEVGHMIPYLLCMTLSNFFVMTALRHQALADSQ
jgi:hypothetical protein